MNQEMVFDKEFTIATEDGQTDSFNYFLHNDIPVIDYNKRGHSFCTNFSNQSWTSKDAPEFADKSLIFLFLTNNLDHDWCSLYHEMGHINYNHPFNNIGRLDYVQDGIVSNYELMADNFALQNMGRERTVSWLRCLWERLAKEINEREEYNKSGYLDSFGQKILEKYYLSREEVRLRLKYL